MKPHFNTAPFIVLGRQLLDQLHHGQLSSLVEEAVEENPWFTPQSIQQALEALCEDLLCEKVFDRWLSAYCLQEVHPKRVGIIMAGNLPLVGFFDLMCVLLCGHEALVKPASKDRVLMRYVCELIQQLDPKLSLRVFPSERQGSPEHVASIFGNFIPEALIATGSDTTRNYFALLFPEIPTLLRGSRNSIALLDGTEQEDELRGLSEDIFSYCGLGCRNVNHLFVPDHYDLERIVSVLKKYPTVHPKYLHNYQQASALKTLQGKRFINGSFFILSEADGTPPSLAQINYTRYTSVQEVERWILLHEDELQCIVSKELKHLRQVNFGQAQHPRPEDYADGADVINFLLHL